jgi:hypothetical protein
MPPIIGTAMRCMTPEPVPSFHRIGRRPVTGRVTSTRSHLPLSLQSYVAVADEPTARSLELYFKSGSGKAFARKRFLPATITLMVPISTS